MRLPPLWDAEIEQRIRAEARSLDTQVPLLPVEI